MTLVELRAKWESRRADAARLGSLAPIASVADDVLADIAQLEQSRVLDTVTLREGHRIGGYSIDHLARLVAAGTIENVGRKHRPRIRRSDVPIKPGFRLREPPSDVMSERRRIVASVANGNGETT